MTPTAALPPQYREFYELTVSDRVKKIEAENEKQITVDKSSVEDSIPASVKLEKVVNITISSISGTDGFIRALKSVLNAVEGFFRESRAIYELCRALGPVLQYAKLAAIALAPFFLIDLGREIYDFACKNIDLGEFLISFSMTIACILDAVGTLLQDLEGLGVITGEIVKYFLLFDLLGIVLSIISIISDARGWGQTAQFSKEFEDVLDRGDSIQEEIDAVLDFINKKDAKVIGTALDADGAALAAKINTVGKNALKILAFEEEKAKKEWEDAIEQLRGRIKVKITSHKLGITISSISLFANTMLFITPFVAPVCPVFAAIVPVWYALKGAYGVISLSNLIYGGVAKYKFESSHLMNVKPIPPPLSFVYRSV